MSYEQAAREMNGAKHITFIRLEFSDGDFIAWPIRNGWDWVIAARTLWRYRKGTYPKDGEDLRSDRLKW